MLLFTVYGQDAFGQKNDLKETIKIGAYYFDGWTGRTNHITRDLTDNFKERESKWGWITSRDLVIDEQVRVAHDAGIEFFNFCWYYSPKAQLFNDVKNNALKIFLASNKNPEFKFSILVANHGDYSIEIYDWSRLVDYWVTLFQNERYFKIHKKPIITFLSLGSLRHTFGNDEKLKEGLLLLRQKCKKAGLIGVNIAICLGIGEKSLIMDVTQCGFDIITGYNYHEAGFLNNLTEIPIDSLVQKQEKIWDSFNTSNLTYIPTLTLNWDERPWITLKKGVENSPRYVGFSDKSVYTSVIMLKRWLTNNRNSKGFVNAAMIFAWNEYGEGSWLTPSKVGGNKLLNSFRKALQEKNYNTQL